MDGGVIAGDGERDEMMKDKDGALKNNVRSAYLFQSYVHSWASLKTVVI